MTKKPETSASSVLDDQSSSESTVKDAPKQVVNHFTGNAVTASGTPVKAATRQAKSSLLLTASMQLCNTDDRSLNAMAQRFFDILAHSGHSLPLQWPVS